jgi:UDP-N-acetylmuramyl pentapeptide phosphotransferase/UDP-N-acetylglucosamine-1-phosphate transferase
MLGDAGSNVIGAVLGLAVVMECASTTRTVLLVVVAAVTLASEFVSFGRVIDRVPALRKLDHLGRGA